MFQGNGNAAIVDRKVDTFPGSIILLSLQWGTDQKRFIPEDQWVRFLKIKMDLGTGLSERYRKSDVLVLQTYNKFSKCASVYP